MDGGEGLRGNLRSIRSGEVNPDDVAGGTLHGESTVQMLPLMPMLRNRFGKSRREVRGTKSCPGLGGRCHAGYLR